MALLPFQDQAIHLSSGQHKYYDTNTRQPVLLMLHGFALRPGLFDLMLAFKDQYRLVVPELPFAASEFNNPHNLETYSDFLIEFLEEKDLNQIAIFGNSIGASLALLLAILKPGLTGKLIVRCPLWTNRQMPYYLRIKPLNFIHKFTSRSAILARQMMKLFYQSSARMSPANSQLLETREVSQTVQAGFSKNLDPLIVNELLNHLTTVEFEDPLDQIKNQVLILWGEDDKLLEKKWANYLEKILESSRVRIMPGEFHNLSSMNQTRNQYEILSFLEEGKFK